MLGGTKMRDTVWYDNVIYLFIYAYLILHSGHTMLYLKIIYFSFVAFITRGCTLMFGLRKNHKAQI